MQIIVLFFVLAGICGVTALLLSYKSKSSSGNRSTELSDTASPNLPVVFSQQQYPSKLGEYQPQPSKMPPVPKAPKIKLFFNVLAFISLAIGIVALFTVDGFSFLFFAGAAICFVIAYYADERHAQNMKHRADAQEQWARTVKARVDTATSEHKAQRDADLQEGQHLAAVEKTKADYISHQLEQVETRVKGELAPTAKELGVSIDAVMQINAARKINEVELEHKQKLYELELNKRWREIVQDLDAADLYEISDQQIINKLTGYLAELLRESYKVEAGDDPLSVKQELLAQYKQNIQYLRDKINERQRLVQAQDGQDASRHTAVEAESRGHSQAEAEADSEQVQTPKRGRGRPRGSANKRGGAS